MSHNKWKTSKCLGVTADLNTSKFSQPEVYMFPTCHTTIAKPQKCLHTSKFSELLCRTPRPPPCFCDQLSFLNCSPSCVRLLSPMIIPGWLLILSNFNFHFDNALSPGVSRITNILASAGLVQRVTGPKHRSGHSQISTLYKNQAQWWISRVYNANI